MTETISYDVIIVGGGPSGLSCAIKLAQLGCQSVVVLDKGGEIGSHIMSGAIMDASALDELLPNWKAEYTSKYTPVTSHKFTFMTGKSSINLPVPPQMKGANEYIISLSELTRFLAEQAEDLGVDILPGFSANELLFDGDKVIGVKTSHADIHAKHTVLAEGARGSLSKIAISKFALDKGRSPQTYGLGIKEVWSIKPELHKKGSVLHSIGWPMDLKTYGGSFAYHADDNKLSIGLIVGLDYENQYLDPFEEMQRLKTHPSIARLLADGERIEYGARCIVEGGIQSLPKLEFSGGLLVGDAAGFLNVARIKGIHGAIISGSLAAQAIFDEKSYEKLFKNSSLYKELYSVRNMRPAFKFGLIAGLVNAGLETILRGATPWTLKNHSDFNSLKDGYKPINYPKPDGILTFDKPSSVYLTGTSHEEALESHLRVSDASLSLNPAQRYCPVGVYEKTKKGFQINFENCIHCKACDIKDPNQNITWTTPQGGCGPNYQSM